VKNFFMSSARVVGEAPFIEVPFMMVTFSVLERENMNCDESGFSSDSASGRFALTATKPDGDALDERPLLKP
jgi:hypothetical protein